MVPHKKKQNPFFSKAPFLIDSAVCFQIVLLSHELLVLSGTLLFPGMGQGWMSPCVCSPQHLDTFDSVPPLMSPPSSDENQHSATCVLCDF